MTTPHLLSSIMGNGRCSGAERTVKRSHFCCLSPSFPFLFLVPCIPEKLFFQKDGCLSIVRSPHTGLTLMNRIIILRGCCFNCLFILPVSGSPCSRFGEIFREAEPHGYYHHQVPHARNGDHKIVSTP